jgi:hypothetical protein
VNEDLGLANVEKVEFLETDLPIRRLFDPPYQFR